MEVYLAAQSDFLAYLLVVDAFGRLKKLSIKLMINSKTKFHRTIGYRHVYSEKSLWVWGSDGYVPIAKALRQLKQLRIYYPPEALIASSE